MNVPNGRGFYVWHLAQACGGDLAALAQHCKDHGITWLAIKWLAVEVRPKVFVQQFTKEVIDTLQAAGVAVWAWHYDLPNAEEPQAAIIEQIYKLGACGYISDSEIEWEDVKNPDESARAFVAAIDALDLPHDFGLAHAPFDVIAGHQRFPYTVLGTICDFVCPQGYWPEHGTSEAFSTKRLLAQFAAYAAKHPEACKALVPSGYSVQPDLKGGKLPTVPDILAFEQRCSAAGCQGVLHWRFDGTPASIWDGIKGTSYPVTIPVAPASLVCAEPLADAPGC